MANNNLTSHKDKERLHKKISKLKDAAWREMNSVSGLSPLYQNRLKVWQAFDKLQSELSDGINF